MDGILWDAALFMLAWISVSALAALAYVLVAERLERYRERRERERKRL